MRFGKRLSELQTQNGQANQPYISYKDLKHILGQLPRLVGGADNNSSGDDAGEASNINGAGAVDPSASSSSSKPISANTLLKNQQKQFFDRIDADLTMASSHVQAMLMALEISIGEWQAQAVSCGLLFTPDQLEEVAANVPFQISDKNSLVQWLIGVQPVSKARPARQALASKYSSIAERLHSMLQYIEVNITAVRKILKKFEKKVPDEFRLRSAQSYKVHHQLFTLDLQHLIVVMVRMHQLLLDAKNLDPNLVVGGPLVSPLLFLGAESLQVFHQICGVQELHDLLSGQPVARSIDVYAKPNADSAAVGDSVRNMEPKVVNTESVSAASQVQARGNVSVSASKTIPVNVYAPPRAHTATTMSSADATVGDASIVPGKTQGGRGGCQHQNVSGQEPAGKGGGRRSKGGRGQRGAGGQPAQGKNAPSGQRRVAGGQNNMPPNAFGNFTGQSGGCADAGSLHGASPNQHPGGKGMNNMSCMYMMVPTNWGQANNFASCSTPLGQFGGKGYDNASFSLQHGVMPDPNYMAAWNRGPLPQQWSSLAGTIQGKGAPSVVQSS